MRITLPRQPGRPARASEHARTRRPAAVARADGCHPAAAPAGGRRLALRSRPAVTRSAHLQAWAAQNNPFGRSAGSHAELGLPSRTAGRRALIWPTYRAVAVPTVMGVHRKTASAVCISIQATLN